MGVLKIVARFEVTDENKQDVVSTILTCAKSSRAEEGNTFYILTEDVSNPNVLVILEEWKSQEAVDFHNTTDHFKALIAGIDGKAKVSIDILKVLDA